MTFLDLCAGIGGFSLGLERAGMTCAGQVEIDDYCNRVLAKHWPNVPRWGDITALDPTALPPVDLVCGGYPCQPFSLAGKRKGAGDDRHLWPAIREIVAHIRPTWCLFENVAGHITLGLDAVLSDLEGRGYACGPLVVPACAVDAPHRRDRVWIVAHAESARERREERNLCEENGGQGRALLFQPDGTGARCRVEALADTQGNAHRSGLRAGEQEEERWERFGDGCGHGGGPFSHPDSQRCHSGPTNAGREAWRIPRGDGARVDTHTHSTGRQEQHAATVTNGQGHSAGAFDAHWRQWAVEPPVGRVAHGVPRRVDRLKALGNAVVPQVVEAIGRAIMAAHMNKGCTP